MNENYRPAYVEFNVAEDGTQMPLSFGVFETETDFNKFLGDNLIAVNSPITVSRHMDFKEKTELRNEYNEILENRLPVLERDASIASSEFEAAKKKFADAKEMVSATFTEAKLIAQNVKRGLVEMRLDDKYTVRIAYKSRYYFYTWIDKELRLVLIKEIPNHEKTEIWNAMSKNEDFIDNGQVAAQEGA